MLVVPREGRGGDEDQDGDRHDQAEAQVGQEGSPVVSLP
jgi:hypothetical protein